MLESAPRMTGIIGSDAVSEAELCQRVARENVAADRADHQIILTGRATVLALLLGSWAWLSGPVLDAQFVSDPLTVLLTLARLLGSTEFLSHIRVTLTEILGGYGIGMLAGLALGLVIGNLDLAQRVLHPFLLAFYAIPRIALAPLIIMWFGLGMLPKVLLAAMFVFFVVFMNTLAGLRNANRDLLNVARVMGASRWHLLRAITIPMIVPYVFTAMRIGVPEAMIGVVIGEFIASSAGLGYAVLAASNQFNTAAVLAGVLMLLLIVFAFDGTVAAAERRLLRWRAGSTVDQTAV